jgi:hypothetical protein
MILMLIILALIVFLIYCEFKFDFEGVGITFAIIFFVIFMIIIPCISYNSYLNLIEFRDGNYIEHKIKAIHQLKGMIEDDDNLIAETKDEYYISLGKITVDLNEEINWYNGKLISKRKMNDNIIFSWFITSPDDNMKVIKTEDYQY